MFNPNQMAELAALKSERYARNGGGGGFVVRQTAKAYYDARVFKNRFAETLHYVREEFAQAASGAQSDFRLACLCLREGIAANEAIPF